MSEVENAQAGAEVAPVENTATTPEQTQAQGSESTTEQVGEQKQEQPRDDKGRFVQQRINELTRARREAERERDHYRQQYESLAQRSQPARSNEGPPSLQNYSSPEEWGAAIAEYSARQALAQAEQRFQQHDQQRQHDQLFQTFAEKEAAFAASAPDYMDRLAELGGVVSFDGSVLEAIALSDHGPAIAYHLATHLDEADRLSRLPPHIAAVQIGRIEAQVSAPKPAKPVSKAPDPAPKVGGASAAPRGLADDLSIEEWMARRTAKL